MAHLLFSVSGPSNEPCRLGHEFYAAAEASDRSRVGPPNLQQHAARRTFGHAAQCLILPMALSVSMPDCTESVEGLACVAGSCCQNTRRRKGVTLPARRGRLSRLRSSRRCADPAAQAQGHNKGERAAGGTARRHATLFNKVRAGGARERGPHCAPG